MTASRLSRSHARLRMAFLGALIALVIGEWMFLDPARHAGPAQGITGSVDAEATLPLPAAESASGAYAAIVTDNLFSESRTSPPHVISRFLAQHADVDSAIARVLGVVVNGAESVALVRLESGGEPVRVHVGDEVGGLVITDIRIHQIVLSDSGFERVIEIESEVAPSLGDDLGGLEEEIIPADETTGDAQMPAAESAAPDPPTDPDPPDMEPTGPGLAGPAIPQDSDPLPE